MKRFLLTALLFSFTLLVFSQSLNDLDKKRGYKDFTLGDLFSKWENSLVFDRKENSETTYRYGGSNSDLFNTYSINGIYLKFVQFKLVNINIILNKWTDKDAPDREKSLKNYTERFGDIGSRFKLLFGGATKTEVPDYKITEGEILWTSRAVWGAKKTHLELTFKYAELQNTGFISVQISDNAYLVKSLTEGF